MSVDLASQWYIFVLFGLAAGFGSSLLGIGGGVILIPLLIWTGLKDPNLARGTSLGYMVGTSLVGAVLYHCTKGSRLNLWLVLLLSVGGIAGAVGGWAVGHRVSMDWLKRMFAVVMIVAAVKLFWDTIPNRGAEKPSRETPGTSSRADR
jgi:uncharacterized membrane protein YfcA